MRGRTAPQEAMMWAMKEWGQRAESDDENFTLMAKSMNFKGVMTFTGTVQIDGRVEGELHIVGTLIVGEHAVIKGLVSTGTLINSGKINGMITATEKIQILKPGLLVGEIRTPVIAIEEGSQFQGTCDMGIQHLHDDRAVPIGAPHGLAASAH